MPFKLSVSVAMINQVNETMLLKHYFPGANSCKNGTFSQGKIKSANALKIHSKIVKVMRNLIVGLLVYISYLSWWCHLRLKNEEKTHL
jgi:hypothetical protein